MAYIFQSTSRIVFGNGAIARLPEEVKRLGAAKCLLVTDRGIVRSGILEKVRLLMVSAGISVEVFEGVEPDPRYQIAQACADFAREREVGCVIGLGGGSSLDIAKLAAVCGTPGSQPIAGLFGIDLIARPGLPLILIPTTAGTGSEVTPIAILSDEEETLKKGVVSQHLLPKTSLLDPELTLGLPPEVTASSGLDALIHAIEAYTSVNAHPLTDLLAVRAMEMIHGSLRKVYADGSDIAARNLMLEGSMLAGIAFANAGVTAVHAFAYPLGAQFHIPHGVANSVMLESVMRFNREGAPEKFARLGEIFAPSASGDGEEAKALAACDEMRKLIQDLNIPTSLRALGIPESAINGMAEGAMKVTRLLANNPRTITLKDAVAIYGAAY